MLPAGWLLYGILPAYGALREVYDFDAPIWKLQGGIREVSTRRRFT